MLVRSQLLIVLRTPVSARSYRASAFPLDWLLFCQANQFVHSFIQLLYHFLMTELSTYHF